MTDHDPIPLPRDPKDDLRRAATAGLLAALVMLFVQLLWRLTLSPAGTPSLPEIVVAAVSRLTPLALFGWATENFGPAAKNTLFVVTLLAVLAVGYEAGATAWRWAQSGRFGSGEGALVKAGLAMAALLLAVVLLVVAPLARLGPLALSSGAAGPILTQLVVTFGLFGLVWAWLTRALAPAPAALAADGASLPQGGSTRRGLIGVGALGLLAGVGAMTWKLFQPTRAVDRAASSEAAQAIAATAEARSTGGAGASPTAAAGTGAAAGSPASGAAEVAQASPASGGGADLALFKQLTTDGELTPLLTSTADFYHVSKNISDPVVGVEKWSLWIGGLAETPKFYLHDDLLQRATTKNITTLACISNELNGDLIGTAEWGGIPLRELLEEVGLDQAKTVDLKLKAADGYEESIPLKAAMDPSTMLVLKMNGEPLTPDHGFPARLIVPPIYGMKNVKWLERIEAIDFDFKGYWQERGWSDPAPYQIWGRFDRPAAGERLALQDGKVTLAGVASAGNRGISRVEISVDGGKTWGDATLEPSINPPFTWVRWLYQFAAEPGSTHQAVLRATDGTGTVMDETERPPLPDGATGWPSRAVRVG